MELFILAIAACLSILASLRILVAACDYYNIRLTTPVALALVALLTTTLLVGVHELIGPII